MFMNRIIVDPQIRFGKPCIQGTRITVQDVLELLNEGYGFTEILESYYPELTVADIQACLQYAIALVAAEEIHFEAVPA
jgi:uncharacterized protein (DUF433 family)